MNKELREICWVRGNPNDVALKVWAWHEKRIDEIIMKLKQEIGTAGEFRKGHIHNEAIRAAIKIIKEGKDE